MAYSPWGKCQYRYFISLALGDTINIAHLGYMDALNDRTQRRLRSATKIKKSETLRIRYASCDLLRSCWLSTYPAILELLNLSVRAQWLLTTIPAMRIASPYEDTKLSLNVRLFQRSLGKGNMVEVQVKITEKKTADIMAHRRQRQ